MDEPELNISPFTSSSPTRLKVPLTKKDEPTSVFMSLSVLKSPETLIIKTPSTSIDEDAFTT